MSAAAWMIPRSGADERRTRCKEPFHLAPVGNVNLLNVNGGSLLLQFLDRSDLLVKSVGRTQFSPRVTFRQLPSATQNQMSSTILDKPVCDVRTESAQSAGDQIGSVRLDNHRLAGGGNVDKSLGTRRRSSERAI